MQIHCKAHPKKREDQELKLSKYRINMKKMKGNAVITLKLLPLPSNFLTF
jgi:hypothetical protein